LVQEGRTLTDRLLPAAIVLLAIATGVIHLALVFVFFRGNFLLNSRSVLFTLNFLGYVVLVAVFLFGSRWLGARRWMLDVALIVYTIAALVAWLTAGAPNPMGLGYLAKGIEVLLIAALVWHLSTLRGGAANEPTAQGGPDETGRELRA
jgi:hypothetical protein